MLMYHKAKSRISDGELIVMPFDLNRRQFLLTSAATGAAAANGDCLFAARPARANSSPFPVGKAEHCIMVWLGGGACQIDTWDPKRLGDPKLKKAGSYYPAIDTAIKGVQVCRHLPKVAKVLDRFNLVRTVHHEVIDEHAAATYRMHTGRPVSGTIVYPSIGSLIANERGAVGQGVPSYVVAGYPNIARGPGFLGAKANFVYLLDTKKGPAGLTRPQDEPLSRRARREKLLAKLRADFRQRNTDDKSIRDYDQTLEQALRLSGPQFAKVFQLDGEPASLRNSYGGEFGQRCLLARRLVQAGVRFIEVSHNMNFVNGTGWDTHNAGQLKQHILIKELDSALSTLVLDLERRKLLDKTLIVVSSEFGRPAKFDGGGGRGHHAQAFTVALAGGGLRNGKPIGTTDELGMKPVDRPVSVPDLFATICCAVGINPAKELYAGNRPVPITDRGQPVRELFA
jgi:Protein of unknown function (DUF1501)/TAT (twin-arginine translocation) pathway signal sequence